MSNSFNRNALQYGGNQGTNRSFCKRHSLSRNSNQFGRYLNNFKRPQYSHDHESNPEHRREKGKFFQSSDTQYYQDNQIQNIYDSNGVENEIRCEICGNIGHTNQYCTINDKLCTICKTFDHSKKVCPLRFRGGLRGTEPKLIKFEPQSDSPVFMKISDIKLRQAKSNIPSVSDKIVQENHQQNVAEYKQNTRFSENDNDPYKKHNSQIPQTYSDTKLQIAGSIYELDCSGREAKYVKPAPFEDLEYHLNNKIKADKSLIPCNSICKETTPKYNKNNCVKYIKSNKTNLKQKSSTDFTRKRRNCYKNIHKFALEKLNNTIKVGRKLGKVQIGRLPTQIKE